MASDTRNRILSVAARLFEANGFEGTAVAAILREADVNSGSLYHFFPSKEALLVAVLEKYVEVLEPALLGAAERAADDPIEKVFALLELYRDLAAGNESLPGIDAHGEAIVGIHERLGDAIQLLEGPLDTQLDDLRDQFQIVHLVMPAGGFAIAVAVTACGPVVRRSQVDNGVVSFLPVVAVILTPESAVNRSFLSLDQVAEAGRLPVFIEN